MVRVDRRRVVRIVAIVVVVLLVVGYGGFVTYVSWKSADSLVHPDRDPITGTPANVGLAFENVTFTTTDGLALSGWWMPEDAPGHNGTVVFLHGYGDNKNQSLKIAPFLVEHAYDVLAFDFRAHGESDGSLTTVGLVETIDVRAAVDYLTERGDVDMERLALVGFSMGAATAINAAPQVPEARAIVADSAFATLTNIASNSITHFTGLPKYPYGPLAVIFAGWIAGHDVGDNRPIDVLRGLDTPILIIQGEADTIAFPGADGGALHSAAAAGELWLVPEATHVRSVELQPEAYAERVVDFLGRHVAPS